MSNDLNTLIKAAVLHHLAQDKATTTLVDKARIYGQSVPPKPSFPFIRYGVSLLTPFNPSGFDGANIRVTLHAFCETTKKGAAEDQASKIGSAIINAMENFQGDKISLLDCEFLSSRVDMEENGRAHAIIEFSILAEAAL